MDSTSNPTKKLKKMKKIPIWGIALMLLVPLVVLQLLIISIKAIHQTQSQGVYSFDFTNASSIDITIKLTKADGTNEAPILLTAGGNTSWQLNSKVNFSYSIMSTDDNTILKGSVMIGSTPVVTQYPTLVPGFIITTYADSVCTASGSCNNSTFEIELPANKIGIINVLPCQTANVSMVWT